ncbi:conserved exported hypothetical protein [Paraburkholderia ribeironis]|uniref:Uncharacterized protein n=1 Tax=Paraburkholderia ribeironis TaxID=1247936 RepID=A0A1N7SQK5_9BURK|nr:conserved exported hypothetical protein [Paraburkholderia ribeironis]
MNRITMKLFNVFAILICSATPYLIHASENKGTENNLKIADSSIEPRRGRNKCWSGKNCTGKIISHVQHAHNCAGKSFYDVDKRQCTNL